MRSSESPRVPRSPRGRAGRTPCGRRAPFRGSHQRGHGCRATCRSSTDLRAARAEAADHEPDVARAVARLRNDSRNAAEGVIETEPVHGSQLGRLDLRYGERRGENSRRRARGGDSHAGEGLGRVARVGPLSECFGPEQRRNEQMREEGWGAAHGPEPTRGRVSVGERKCKATVRATIAESLV